MSCVLIIGGGITGITAATELANGGQEVIVLETASDIGGKVREYGCKAAGKCLNCGVCLSGGLWEAAENNPRIQIHTNTKILDITGVKGNFSVTCTGPRGRGKIRDIAYIVVAVGFELSAGRNAAGLELADRSGVISGHDLEKLLHLRRKDTVLPENVSSVAFIQCCGSRDIQEKADYCSRVCCAYSTRAARALKSIHSDIKVTFFFMDLQRVENGPYYDALTGEGFEFIRCRPVKIQPGKKPEVLYEKPETGKVAGQEFDLVVLTEGIHPPRDAVKLSELCTLSLDDRGFLKTVRDGSVTGIFVAGCASGPKGISECSAEAKTVSGQILNNIRSDRNPDEDRQKEAAV